MTANSFITLTREEAQKVLDGLMSGGPGANRKPIVDMIRARLTQPEERLFTEAQALDIAQKLADCAVLGSVPPSGTTWQNAALRLGEELSTVGPDGYYNMTARQWLDWAMENVTPARLAQPEPEPVAWMFPDDLERFEISETFAEAYSIARISAVRGETVPLYTAPPQREWQGLTDEEIKKEQHHIDWTNVHTYAKFARAIEAKLKEKNSENR